MSEITYRDKDILRVLGKRWQLRLVQSTDEIWQILAGDLNIAALTVPTENGGFVYILTDKGDPKESLGHEMNEIFLTEIRRKLNEEGGEADG